MSYYRALRLAAKWIAILHFDSLDGPPAAGHTLVIIDRHDIGSKRR